MQHNNLTLAQAASLLRVSKHRLDDELEIQPEMMQRIAECVVAANSRAIEAKDELERVSARLFDEFRDGDAKLSIDAAKGRVTQDRSRRQAWQAWQTARVEHERWQHMLEAWRQKGYSMKTLAELHGAQYFSTDNAGRHVDRAPSPYEQGRRALRDARAAATEETAVPPAHGTRRMMRR